MDSELATLKERHRPIVIGSRSRQLSVPIHSSAQSCRMSTYTPLPSAADLLVRCEFGNTLITAWTRCSSEWLPMVAVVTSFSVHREAPPSTSVTGTIAGQGPAQPCLRSFPLAGGYALIWSRAT